MLLPQGGVATIETASNIDREAAESGSVGTLRAGGGEWPAYALASDFKPQAECPPSYKYCVAINCDNQAAFSLVCEEVGTVSLISEDELKPLQDCMRTDRNPIESLLLKDNKLMLVSDIEAMQQYLLPEAAA